MIVRSLRWRLLIAGGIAIFLALVVAWALMMLLFERHLERRVAAELEQDAIRVVAGIAIAPDGRFSIDEPPADARFQTPLGGLYWQATWRGQARRSPSLWDQALPPPPSAPAASEWRTRIAPGPFEQRLIYLERMVVPERGGAPVLVQVAQDAAVIDAAGREFGRELALFLALLWLFLAAAAWLQVHLGLRPLRQIPGLLAQLEQSPSARLPDDGASEVRPLVGAINRLAEAREQDLERARRRATDLAHGLKTPIAAAAAQLRRAGDDADHVAGVEKALAAMKRVVDAELARSRVAAAGRAAGRADCLATVERLVAVLERTEAGERLVLDVEISPGLIAPLAEEDLTEALGGIAENAVRYARRRVVFGGAREDSSVRLWVEDDGPGIDRAQMARALERGLRLDESGGQGLGLAIARDLAEATGGSLSLSRAALGGLRVELGWSA